MSIDDVDDRQDAVDEGSPALTLSVQPEGLLSVVTGGRAELLERIATQRPRYVSGRR